MDQAGRWTSKAGPQSGIRGSGGVQECERFWREI